MTKEESWKFIHEVLKGLWPDWETSDMEGDLWSQKLRECDYHATKISIKNWYISQQNPGRRPIIGKMKKLFMKAVDKQQQEDNEPVLLYTIVDESLYERGIKTGMNYTANKRSAMPKDPQVIEEQAERMREKANRMYGENHIILRHWESEYYQKASK